MKLYTIQRLGVVAFQLNKAKEVYHYCSLSSYVFHTDNFMQAFFMFRFRLHYVWPRQTQRKCMELST